MSVLEWLMEPEVRQCAVDGPERLTAHRAVLARKRMIREVFREFHETFASLDSRFLWGEGATIELGAGVYPVRETLPGILATDVMAAPHLDRVLDACCLDLPDASVHAFYLQNVFHHFPRPRVFFRELERTLVHGGGAIFIEPADGPVASFLYPRLFSSEGFDKTAPAWESRVEGPMSGANQALCHLVFDRDFEDFQAEFPALEVVYRDVLGNYLRYLASGGLNFRALLPDRASGVLRRLETWLRPLRGVAGLHRVIVLRKRGDA
jgi:SAM-dependent methyltransferase